MGMFIWSTSNPLLPSIFYHSLKKAGKSTEDLKSGLLQGWRGRLTQDALILAAVQAPVHLTVGNMRPDPQIPNPLSEAILDAKTLKLWLGI